MLGGIEGKQSGDECSKRVASEKSARYFELILQERALLSVQLPVVQAMLLADQVYVDGRTGKHVIAGTFNRLQSSEFPSFYSKETYLYLKLTNIRGQYEISLSWVDLDDGTVLMKSPTITAESNNPLSTAEITMTVPPFPMPHQGMFALELFANEERIGAIRVSVDESQEASTDQ